MIFYVSKIDGLHATPGLTSHKNFCVRPTLVPEELLIHKVGILAVVVSNAKFIQRIELDDQMKSLDATKVGEDYLCKLLTIPISEGWLPLGFGELRVGRWADARCRPDSPQAPAWQLKFGWTQIDRSMHLGLGFRLPGDLSPNLGVLVVDAEVFDITAVLTLQPHP